MSCLFCFVRQSGKQLDAEGEAKQKALWNNQNSALKLCQTSGSGEASSGKKKSISDMKDLEQDKMMCNKGFQLDWNPHPVLKGWINK